MNALSHSRAAAWLVIAALGGCAEKQKPAAQAAPEPRPPTAAEESQKAFQMAAQEQRELTEQQKRVDAAHGAVLAAQRQLARAQAQEELERSKSQALRDRTNQHLQEGVRQAQGAQASLGAAGGTDGFQTVTGRIIQTSPSQIIVYTPAGRVLPLTVDARTRVLVGNESRSVAEIQRGADAQVAFDPKPGESTALVIRVLPAGVGAQGQTPPPPAGAQAPNAPGR